MGCLLNQASLNPSSYHSLLSASVRSHVPLHLIISCYEITRAFPDITHHVHGRRKEGGMKTIPRKCPVLYNMVNPGKTGEISISLGLGMVFPEQNQDPVDREEEESRTR